MFYKYPKLLDTNEKYRSLPTDAKHLYIYLLSLHELSEKNKWKDAEGRTFVICPRDKMADLIGVSTRTAIRLVKSLSDVGLVEIKKQRYENSPRMYVKNLLPEKKTYKNNADTDLFNINSDEISRALFEQYINS